MPSWSLKKALTMEAMRIPYHPGAIRYLEEDKPWTPEMEAEAPHRRGEPMKKIRDEAVAEATSKGMKEKEFTEFWAKKRGR